jgi:hypothetical protein
MSPTPAHASGQVEDFDEIRQVMKTLQSCRSHRLPQSLRSRATDPSRCR